MPEGFNIGETDRTQLRGMLNSDFFKLPPDKKRDRLATLPAFKKLPAEQRMKMAQGMVDSMPPDLEKIAQQSNPPAQKPAAPPRPSLGERMAPVSKAMAPVIGAAGAALSTPIPQLFGRGVQGVAEAASGHKLKTDLGQQMNPGYQFGKAFDPAIQGLERWDKKNPDAPQWLKTVSKGDQTALHAFQSLAGGLSDWETSGAGRLFHALPSLANLAKSDLVKKLAGFGVKSAQIPLISGMVTDAAKSVAGAMANPNPASIGDAIGKSFLVASTMGRGKGKAKESAAKDGVAKPPSPIQLSTADRGQAKKFGVTPEQYTEATGLPQDELFSRTNDLAGKRRVYDAARHYNSQASTAIKAHEARLNELREQRNQMELGLQDTKKIDKEIGNMDTRLNNIRQRVADNAKVISEGQAENLSGQHEMYESMFREKTAPPASKQDAKKYTVSKPPEKGQPKALPESGWESPKTATPPGAEAGSIRMAHRVEAKPPQGTERTPLQLLSGPERKGLSPASSRQTGPTNIPPERQLTAPKNRHQPYTVERDETGKSVNVIQGGAERPSTTATPPSSKTETKTAPPETKAVKTETKEVSTGGKVSPVETKQEGRLKEKLPISEIKVDPKRFQFKQRAVGKSGTIEGEVSPEKFDRETAGVISVWRDPATKEVFVVNGHHRLERAKKSGESDIDVQFMKAKTAEEARTKGALINISEGKGDALDAAKLFREAGFDAQKLSKLNVDPRSLIARQGLALSKLSDNLYSKVASGAFEEGKAAIIGELLGDPVDQKGAFDLAQRAEKRGKKVTDAEFREAVRMQVTDAARAKVQKDQANFWGEEATEKNLVLEKGEVSEYIRQQLRSDRRLFGAVGKESASAKLGAKGNTINTEGNAQIADQAKQAMAVYDRLSDKSGPVREILESAAKELAEGGSARDVKQRAYERVRDELGSSLSQIFGSGVRGASGGSEAPPRDRRDQAATTGQLGLN